MERFIDCNSHKQQIICSTLFENKLLETPLSQLYLLLTSGAGDVRRAIYAQFKCSSII